LTATGSAYVFERTGGAWKQRDHLKAPNAEVDDQFGLSLTMSADGSILAVGAYMEDSASVGIGGLQDNGQFSQNSGAVYLFERVNNAWPPPTYIKASNTEANDFFGLNLALSPDGNILAVTARDEDGLATGVSDKAGADGLNWNSGAVYVFDHAGGVWAQRAYVKASNTGMGDRFGLGVALSDSDTGRTLAVGADYEDSNAKGLKGDQANNSVLNAGAVYVY
jgi:hypothetical protein